MTKNKVLITTYQYRIKDSNTALVRALLVLSGKVNYIWNYLNATQQLILERNKAGYKYQFWLDKYSSQELTKGSSALINLPAQTIQSIQEEYVNKRTQFKKSSLKFRTNRKNRNLPWIPFKTQDIKVDNKGTFSFCGLKIKTWYSSYIPNNVKITNGNIVCNNLGQWFINITFKKELTEREDLLLTSLGQNKTGIDIGLNPFMTQCIEKPLSIDEINNLNLNKEEKVYTKIEYKEISPEQYYRKSEEKLGNAQRARRFKQAKKINNKIKNKRKDYLHKLSTKLVMGNTHVIMGLVELKKLINKSSLKGHSKSWTDNGYGKLRTMLKTQAQKHSMVYEEVIEREIKSTQTCSCCGKITGPKGLEGLGVSQWKCIGCGAVHNRNENSAKNHLLARTNSQREAEEKSPLVEKQKAKTKKVH